MWWEELTNSNGRGLIIKMADEQRAHINFSSRLSSSANYHTGSYDHSNNAQGQQHQQWWNNSGYQGLHSYSVTGSGYRQTDFTGDSSELSYGSFQESGSYPVSQQQQQQQHFYPQARSHVTEDTNVRPQAPLPPHESMHHTTYVTQGLQQLPLMMSDHYQSSNFDHSQHEKDQFKNKEQDLRAQYLSVVQEDNCHDPFVPSRLDVVHGATDTENTIPIHYKGSFKSKVQKFVVKHGEVFNALTQDRSAATLVNTPTLHNHSSYSEESCVYNVYSDTHR